MQNTKLYFNMHVSHFFHSHWDVIMNDFKVLTFKFTTQFTC